MTYDEFYKRGGQNHRELRDEYFALLRETRGFPEKKIQLDSEYVAKGTEQDERLAQEYLTQQIGQIQLVRSVTRISPVTLIQHLLEVFVGTGFETASTIFRECASLCTRIPRIRHGYG